MTSIVIILISILFPENAECPCTSNKRLSYYFYYISWPNDWMSFSVPDYHRGPPLAWRTTGCLLCLLGSYGPIQSTSAHSPFQSAGFSCPVNPNVPLCMLRESMKITPPSILISCSVTYYLDPTKISTLYISQSAFERGGTPHPTPCVSYTPNSLIPQYLSSYHLKIVQLFNHFILLMTSFLISQSSASQQCSIQKLMGVTTSSSTELLIDHKKVFVHVKCHSLLSHHILYLSTVLMALQ